MQVCHVAFVWCCHLSIITVCCNICNGITAAVANINSVVPSVYRFVQGCKNMMSVPESHYQSLQTLCLILLWIKVESQQITIPSRPPVIAKLCLVQYIFNIWTCMCSDWDRKNASDTTWMLSYYLYAFILQQHFNRTVPYPYMVSLKILLG